MIDHVQYSLDGGSSWVNTGGLSYMITGLNPSTTYNIVTRIRDASSGLYTNSGVIYGTTASPATITGNNFNLGDSVTVSMSRPSVGETVNIGIYLTDASTAVIPYFETSATTSYTFNFTDEQITNLYKYMGTSNSITVVFYARTSQNGYNYWNTSSKTCTLTGNVKTVWHNVNGTWKHCKLWRKINGTWRRCVRWQNVNGVWKRCC